MGRCLASAARPEIHPARICIYWYATPPTDPWTPMAGGAVVPTHGLSTRENPYGWHSRPLYLRIFIPLALHLPILLCLQQALSWMMARRISMKLPMNAGMISPRQARRVASCVPRGRAPPRLPALPNGFSRRARTLALTRSISASPPLERLLKVRSIPSAMQMKAIRW